MKMVMIVFNETLTGEVEALLAKLGITSFTEWYPATGCGQTGGKHMGNHIFPGNNKVRVMAVSAAKAEEVRAACAPAMAEWKKEGCKLFAWNCEELG